MGFALPTKLFLQRIVGWRIHVSLDAFRFSFLSLSFRVSVGRLKVISQIFLEVVIISDALHAPDDQSLTKNVIRWTYEDEGRKYLRPGVEILHDLSHGDPTFEAFILLGCPNFGLGRFSTQLPAEENSRACLFSGIGFKRMVSPIILNLPA